MVEKVPPHRHCKECGRPIALEDKFCSEKCSSAFRGKLKRRKNQLYFYYAVTAMILIAALIYLGYG